MTLFPTLDSTAVAATRPDLVAGLVARGTLVVDGPEAQVELLPGVAPSATVGPDTVTGLATSEDLFARVDRDHLVAGDGVVVRDRASETSVTVPFEPGHGAAGEGGRSAARDSRSPARAPRGRPRARRADRGRVRVRAARAGDAARRAELHGGRRRERSEVLDTLAGSMGRRPERVLCDGTCRAARETSMSS